MDYYAEKILEWFRENRWTHAGNLREIALPAFGLKAAKLDTYMKGLVSMKKIEFRAGYYYLPATKRLKNEVFPWEK